MWSEWSKDCSVTCGDGVVYAYRECTNPRKVGDGLDCFTLKNKTAFYELKTQHCNDVGCLSKFVSASIINDQII